MTEPTIYGIKWEPPQDVPCVLGRGIDDEWVIYPIASLPKLLQEGRDVHLLAK